MFICLSFQVPDSSWQLLGSRTTQPGQQTSSPLPAQQRHQGFLGDRHKTSASLINYGRPILPPTGHASNVSTSDALGSQKVSQGNHFSLCENFG